MARPERHDVDYFPLLVKSGKTLTVLQNKYGIEGYGFFYKMLSFLAITPDHHYKIKDESDLLHFMSLTLMTDEKKVIDMIELMVKTEKLDKELWRNHKVIACPAFLESIKDAYNKRNNVIITIEEIRAKYTNSDISSPLKGAETPFTATETGLSAENGDNNPQSKVKKSKVKKSKEICGKPHKPRLRDREPENDFEFVEKAYWTNWDMLYSKKLVQTEDPFVNWGQSRKLLKNYFDKNIKPIQLVEIINGALRENWIMQKGYSLTNILSSSYINSVINKINVLSDSVALVATPLYNTALDCFIKEPAIKAMIFQDEYSKNIQFQCLQDIIARCLNIAPNMPKELFINITEHFYALCNGKYKGKWTYTPRCLKTNWIWELVIDSLPKTESPEVKQIIRGLFK
ncbi:MAG: DUF4373 domain-containing protein [Treponema sp.]|nr:DUF4373 domain-containing protein [Treponema sp.]